jgi:TPR repeat protein
VRAQTLLGKWWLYGIGVPENKAEAVRWFHRAAERGHAGAQFHVGRYYLYGWEIPIHEEEARKWLRKAAEQGHERAKELLQSIDRW